MNCHNENRIRVSAFIRQPGFFGDAGVEEARSQEYCGEAATRGSDSLLLASVSSIIGKILSMLAL